MFYLQLIENKILQVIAPIKKAEAPIGTSAAKKEREEKGLLGEEANVVGGLEEGVEVSVVSVAEGFGTTVKGAD